MSAVSCKGIGKSFGSVRVLENLDLEVPDKAVLTVLGHSGSGKTTLLRLIAGFERPDHGTIAIGEELVDSPERFVSCDRRRLGFVAQEGALFPHLTVAKNVGFGLARSERSRARIGELLDMVGLGELGSRYPHQLSGGQQQRVALARALAPRPELVLLDEPFSSLDAGLREALRADVIGILRAQGTTTILVTHDRAEALSVSDLVAVIDGGKIRQTDTPEKLYTHPRDATVATFLGDANLLDGLATDHGVVTAVGTLSLHASAEPLAGAVTVLIRPEQISVEAAEGGWRVLQRDYFGHDCLLTLGSSENDATLRIRCLGPAPVVAGEHVRISVRGQISAWPAA